MGKKSRRNKAKGNAAPSRPAPARANIDGVVAKLLSPDRVQGVPQHLQRPDALKSHLLQVMQPTGRVQLLTVPLLQGLMNGHPHLDIEIQVPGSEPYPLLTMICQWKMLQRRCEWKGGDELVSMVLAAGVDVNAVTLTKCNAAFFAVKYGSPTTLDLLIKAGINIHQVDKMGRTCLWNALERPSPAMLRCLLDYLPATEMFPTFTGSPEGAVCQISAADRCIDLFIRDTSEDGTYRRKEPFSWQELGPPSIEDVAESLILLRQRGARFTNNEVSFADWKVMGCVARGEKEIASHPDCLKQLVGSILGFWLPPAIQAQLDEIDELQEGGSVAEGDCPICLNPLQEEAMDSSRALELYCHHTFCQRCIVDYGAGTGRNCPVCHRRLCKEIVPQNEGVAPDLNRRFGLVNSHESGLRGPLCLSGEQVVKEAKIQGVDPILSYNSTKRAIFTDPVTKRHLQTNGIELSSTHTITGAAFMLMAPSRGPAMVEIAIKGVPVVARLSNNSFYTCISSSVVNTFRLKRLESLTSSKFRDAVTGTRLTDKTITCLEEFTFLLGGIEITLRNAVEVEPDLDGAGVQLGQDFFLSAAWCVADVETAEATYRNGNRKLAYMRTDATASWIVFGCDSESLRYYGHDGKTAHVPLLHYNPHKDAKVSAMTLKPDTLFNECSWCTRTFPKGMLRCGVCSDLGVKVYYCDQRCQTAAWKLHKVQCKTRRGS